MKKIYYWEQAFILQDLSEFQALLKNVLKKLLIGDYALAGLEQLKHQGKTIYSARINKKARVIFINFNKDSQSSLLILDVLENHEYERCQFLNNQYIKAFLGSINPEELVRCETPEALPIEPLPALTEINLQGLHYFQGQMIELTLPQYESLHLPLPALIEGEAGSGKTCVGLCALSNFLNEHREEEVKILYLAPFAHLVHDMQVQWQSLNGNARAQFKTYDDLFTIASIASTQLIDWITRVAFFPASFSQTLLQEFAMMQIVETPESYFSLGEKQSLVTGHDRRKIWELFQIFMQHFNFQESYHPWFTPLQLSEKYDFIFIDESQSFTTHQLLQILTNAKNHAVLAGFDRHQRVAGDRRDMLRFKAICHIKNIPLHHSQLIGSFRCSPQVVQLVNNLLSIKYTLAQGRPDKGSILKYESKKEELGQVHYFLESKDEAKIRELLPQAGPPH